MVTPATSHLGRLIDSYQRRHSASIGGLADRIGVSRQTLRQWRVGELRSLPTQTNLSATAAEIGCPYAQVLDAALRDAGYLGAGDTGVVDPTVPPTDAGRFIQNALIAQRYTGGAGQRAHETAHGPAIWTMAHRGYSGSRRVDVWAYPDEASALRAAAQLGLDCGLDEDDAAVKAFAREDYRAVLDRHHETAPDWQILAVTLTPFVGPDGELAVTSAGIDHIPPTPTHLHEETCTATDEELAVMEGDEEFSEIVAMISSRQATLIADAAAAIAAAIRSDADTLGSAPVTEHMRGQLQVLSKLPAITFGQSRLWRYQLADAADRLAGDTRRWGAPIPRCTGEEMVLHLILHQAQAMVRPRQVRSGSWDQLSELLFQDADVLTLYDLPPEATESLAGGINLHPLRWFSEFTLPFPMPDRP
jgi:hypothetical protein